MSRTNIRLPPKWIELNITKTECAAFVSVPDDPMTCQCGRKKDDHDEYEKPQHRPITWSPRIHTKVSNTDAYGTILFDGEHHPNKAHYVRLSYDSSPELIIQLMKYVWNLEMPQLLISVRGGSTNFAMSARLGKIFQTGIIKAARNTNAWIFSNGLNSGVSKHLGNALSNEKWIAGLRKGRVTAVGIASWGMVENREELIGKNKERAYSPLDNTSKFLHLNSKHSDFLLVDNGSIGKFGGENYLRRRLEKCISSYPIGTNRGCDTPVVVVVLEGGFYTLRQIGDYLYDEPPIPVVIFSGTGRSADLVSFVVRKVASIEEFDNIMKEKIYHKITQFFHVNSHQCFILYKELRKIYKRRTLITVYNPNSTNEEFDGVILSSIFRSQHWSPLQQLSLTLAWNRVDIAQTEVFIYGRDWAKEHLQHAMMEALLSNRLDFVDLLLEHGLNMQTFLTASTLEALYSLERMPSQLLRSLLTEFSKGHTSKNKQKLNNEHIHNQKYLTLHDIGVVLSHMIGHVYQSSYIHLGSKRHMGHGGSNDKHEVQTQTFVQPFDDLFIWAVLTKRHEMSKLLWRHGKGALAKALIAVKLNRHMASEINTAEKNFTSTLAVDYENYTDEWENLSVSLLDSCYRANPKMARQLLTMQLDSWSKQTCLTLAVIGNHRTLLGHSCCQILLKDLWMGALNIKSKTALKIILGIMFPPVALCLEFKSKEELKLLPHQEKTGHAFGGSATTTNQQNHDDFNDIHTLVHSSDPEKVLRYGPSLILSTSMSVHGGRPGRTTDLDIVAQSIFPSKEDYNQLQKDNLLGSGTTTTSTQYEPPIVVPSTETRQTNTNRNHFKFKLRNNNIKLEEYETATSNEGKFDRSSFVTMEQSLGPWRKFVEFQTAPITNYTRHTMGYLTFLVAFVYIILYTQDPHTPGWVEWYVMACFATQFLECIREFFRIEALTFLEKLTQLQRNLWQLGDCILITVCLGAAVLRLTGYFEYAMLIYRTASIYWNFRSKKCFFSASMGSCIDLRKIL